MGRDPDYLAFMRRRLASAPPAGPRSVGRLRREHAADLAPLPRPAVEVVRDLALDGPAGPLRARLYRPRSAAPLPALVYFHGGGWILGDVESYDPVVRALAVASGLAWVSVDYRRPPEAPFPAPLDDAAAAVPQVAARARDLGLDAERIGVAGDSAGGQLAASAALHLRGGGDALAAQVLLYPAVDLREVPPAPPDPDGLEFGPSGLDRIVRLYLAGTDPALPEVSPLTAPDLSGLPPAVIATAEYDRLRPQAERYAERLRSAGVRTVLIGGTGLDHGFLGWGSFARRPAEAVARIGAAVRDVLLPA
ncbi:alpha/beta hydrolase [Actinomadura viridis]|uniref:Acetyl esterase n=1 Tax=Actinomadura viridis TaxID=58110 RepID=A0A931DME6_9ACTN|nr:alpha/beta hydrolase [Actinomadura viridis]MBG6089760.1 acetyl esterase [Actinomadura viridis]